MTNSNEKIYFIALLPPADFQAEATKIKEYFAAQYNSSHALKSPPHITLQAPFKWHEQRLPELAQFLATFAATYPPVPIILSGFGAFPPRVIYINPLKTPELMAVQADLTARLQSNLGIVDEKDNGRPFSPHMTVAFKDLSKSAFKAAWPEFKQRPLFFQFEATNLTLLVHEGGRWHVKSEFPFVPSV